MILLDTNQLFLASYFVHRKLHEELDEHMLRHLFLNTIRMYRKQFKDEYGEVVLCLESSDCWRKEVFPNYKANRKKKVKDDSHDWNQVFGLFEQYLSEISGVFPYMQLRVPHTEADDIIAVVCQQFHCDEKIMILSNDKDFMQLQRYPSIKQYSPIKKELLECRNPKDFLLEHILKGDASDGIPNILSDGDTFIVDGKRQKPVGKKRMMQMISDGKLSQMENWKRNQTLVDFTCIPDTIRDEIIRTYKNEKSIRENQRQEIKIRPGQGLFSNASNFLLEKKLNNLLDLAGDFV